MAVYQWTHQVLALARMAAFGYQARAFLDEVAGLEGSPSNQRVIRRGCAQYADPAGGRAVRYPRRKEGFAVKLGVYNAILHSHPLTEALKVIARPRAHRS